ncbi:hypothetical protein E6Q11_03385 [Candidatus Dojkabacteria bacterium]|uniref:Uncharacterized protein n=1 Tax=Candidatus Dojkabacteria bacterium TaxID=2099670 RepID=A0A5C7J970_9BACT|nr:MAG: hypothetical protein E6Q11_03385 [Candidatus Dojkabacteria bacterium]
MAKIAYEVNYGTQATYVYPGGYDSSKLGLGPLMIQSNGGGEDSFVGPLPVGLARPFEQSTAIPGIYPWAMQWSSNTDWVFLADNATAAATRRIVLYTYNRTTGAFAWQGFITVGFPFAGTQGTYTITGLRMTYDTYSTGTVAVSGTTVTGSGTDWANQRIAGGARIGFGSTDPTQITTWYEISPSTTPTATSITLSTNAGTISSGTSYVIEELRAIILVKNGTTATNGGLFIVKGLNFSTFQPIVTSTIAAATTTDNIRATFWVKDASTSTNTNGTGLAIQPKDSNTQHYIWVLQGTTTMQLYKFNLRAALTLTSGADTANSWQFATGVTAALTGTASQANNGRLANMSSGPGSGLNCIYFTTTTRIYRTSDVSTITTGATNFLADNSAEIPPGGTNTFAATSALNSIEFADSIDKMIVITTGASGVRSYITQYRTDSGQWDRIFLVDNKQIDQSIADSSTTPIPSILGRAFTVWSQGGMAYLAGIGTAATTNLLYAIPTGADWQYASSTNCRIVTPEISTPNAYKYSKVITNAITVLGGATGQGIGVSPEPFRTYYRTSGISDNSGSWTLLDDTGNLASVNGASSIQFMYEFRTIGQNCVPARLLNTVVTYDDLSTDSHYQPSVTNSSASTKIFAWRFSTAFGGTVPTLRIRLYNAVTNGLLLDDDSASPTEGTWEKSTDGGSNWSSYNTTDKANETTYIRYTPTSIADNIKVRALLTQN